ncbi:ras GEF [Testicularia cyperi]|uniref:Ras GEF n=1 Tax=Testicularia cyperi TaxID=1882483 RepID=A0A317XU19_9BASI|nr:ras GEF [Testicularia cyperi]
MTTYTVRTEFWLYGSTQTLIIMMNCDSRRLYPPYLEYSCSNARLQYRTSSKLSRYYLVTCHASAQELTHRVASAPLEQPSITKKKPAFASFWERQSTEALAATGSASTSRLAHDAASHSVGSVSRSNSTSHSKSSSTPAPTGAGFVGVQRLIQQYSSSSSAATSATSAAAAAAAAAASSSSSSPASTSPTSQAPTQSILRRSFSGMRAVSAASSSSERPLGPDTLVRRESTPLRSSSISSLRSPNASQSRTSFEYNVNTAETVPKVGLRTEVRTTSPARATTPSMASSQVEALQQAGSDPVPVSPRTISNLDSLTPDTDGSPKPIDVDRSRRHRKLLKEQLRKRNLKRRSAGTHNPAAELNDAELDDVSTSSDDADYDAADAGDKDAVETGQSQRHHPDNGITASISSCGSSSDGNDRTEDFYDLPNQLSVPVRSAKSSAVAFATPGANQTLPGRPSSLEDTRPWLEFSPLLPDSDLMDGPTPEPLLSTAVAASTTRISALDAHSLELTPVKKMAAAPLPLATLSAMTPPSGSTSGTTRSSDSPVSPTGLGFSSAVPYASSSSYLSLSSPTHTPGKRSHRATRLPPPRPTPSAPLPPPPSVASATATPPPAHPIPGSQHSRAAMRQSTANSPSHASHADPFSDTGMRSRSYSLEQEVASADRAGSETLRAVTDPAAISGQKESGLVATVTQKSSGAGPTSDKPSGAAAQASPLSATASPTASNGGSQRDSRESQGSARPGNPLRVPVGRPRGFTVGAVPSGQDMPLYRGSCTLSASARARPRSLLSNEIFPGLDLADPRIVSDPRNTDVVSSRNARSMDVSRHCEHTDGAAVGDQDFATLRPPSGGKSKSYSGSSAMDRTSQSSTGVGTDSLERRPSVGGRSRSASSASLLQQVNSQPKSHASFVVAVVGHAQAGKSTVIRKGLRQFGLSKPHVLSEKVTSHSTVCVVDHEQRTIEVLEIDATVLLNGPSKRFAWPKFLPHIDAVILCYDASEIASFRGMSELLENFAIANLSTVMLACKSEVHPKAVDPYYASDMASVYNVGLAECSVKSDEGKKRMRDCFSYLVKEVAKARSGRSRKAQATTIPTPSSATGSAVSLPSSSAAVSTMTASRSISGHRKEGSQTSSVPSFGDDGPHTDNEVGSGGLTRSARGSISSVRGRGNSNASSNFDHGLTSSGLSSEGSVHGSHPEGPSSILAESLSAQHAVRQAEPEAGITSRKMSNATVASTFSEAPSGRSEDEVALQESLVKAHRGLQSSRASGGYVSIDELWDKLFHAAISRTDERFVTTFMVFYRGFATPVDLLTQMTLRFDALTNRDVAEGMMHRFALIRLTNMLGDWVQDYPGDLSHPDTHAQLLNFHRRLLQHPDSTHTAGQIRATVEATAHAPDLDAVWSRSVNTGRSQHPGHASAGDVPLASHASSSDDAGGSPLFLPKSSSSSSNAASFVALEALNGEHEASLRTESHLDHGSTDRAGSDSSLPLHPERADGIGRSRSVSDVTTSSIEATQAGTEKNGKVADTYGPGEGASSSGSLVARHNASSSTHAGAASLTEGSSSGDSVTRAQNHMLTLRYVSNMLLDIDDEDIASEMTRLEWAFFTAIQPRDLLRHILVPHELRDGPVARSISHFNYVSNWVCSMILAQGKTKHRARMLEKFYNIASILRHDNNYGSLNSVLAGLSKTAVHRLKHTRELLKGKAVNKVYLSLVRLMSNERSSAAYRLALENSDGPTIPYVGVHLQDILSISDGNPSKRAVDGMIHWRKFSLMDEAVMAVAKCQQYDRFIKPIPSVEKLILGVPVLDDEALYERSLVVEPRSQGAPAIATSKIKDLKIFLQNQTSSGSGH